LGQGIDGLGLVCCKGGNVIRPVLELGKDAVHHA